MSVVNKRNALLGWGVWKVGKLVAKKKAREALPLENGSSRRKVRVVVPAVAALGGALFFWRRLRNGDGD